MSTKRGVRLTSLVFLLVAAISVLPALLAADASRDSKEVFNLLSQAKTDAIQLNYAVSEMEAFKRIDLRPESHTAKITQIKESVNEMVGTVNKLNRARSTASPAQQEAIDLVTPALKELVTNVQETIAHLNMNRQRLDWCVRVDPAYKELLTRNAKLAAKVAEVSETFSQIAAR
ncbi:MAG: hypothetical protein HY313_07360 [Acidobacteria bacterium]|nr:hypothetical protein [Acidobacteriota bacterium]